MKAAALDVRRPVVPAFPCLRFHDGGVLRAAEQETVGGAETPLMLTSLKLAINSVKTVTLCLPRHTVVGKGEDQKI